MNTTDKVLTILLREKRYVSGEEISEMIGLSRASVNSAVKSLRSIGYEIDSVTNKGYMLISGQDILSLGAIGEYLDDKRLERVVVLDRTDSTNKVLREMAFDGASPGTTVIANEQNAGRGRMGRNFFSPRDCGIYLSYLMKPDTAPSDAVTVTAWTAVAMVRAIERVAGIRPDIKWVNDIMFNRLKLCGILTEMSVESETGRIASIIIGIGINVKNKTSDFPKELKKIATSLAVASGKIINRAELAAAMITELDKMSRDWPNKREEYLAAYREADMTCGCEVNVLSGESKRLAMAVKINDDFSLKVRYPDGKKEDLSSGEVSLKVL